MKGKDASGFKTTQQSFYPSELCHTLAAAYLQHRLRMERHSPELQRRHSASNIQSQVDLSQVKAKPEVANLARSPSVGTQTEGEVGANPLAVAAVAVPAFDD